MSSGRSGEHSRCRLSFKKSTLILLIICCVVFEEELFFQIMDYSTFFLLLFLLRAIEIHVVIFYLIIKYSFYEKE